MKEWNEKQRKERERKGCILKQSNRTALCLIMIGVLCNAVFYPSGPKSI